MTSDKNVYVEMICGQKNKAIMKGLKRGTRNTCWYQTKQLKDIEQVEMKEK